MLPAWSASTASAVPDDQPFTAIRGFEPTGSRVRVEPRDYAASRVDVAALRSVLPGGTGSTVVRIPGPDGDLQAFRVERTQRMESQLAAAHPEIGTWSGRGVDDTRASIALDITPMGVHAFVRTPGGTGDWYVDPAYNRRGTTAHLSYRSSSLPPAARRRAEGEVATVRDTVEAAAADRSTAAGEPVQRHFYRLALTSDPSYAAYFGTDNVLAEKVTLINRVNQIYNDDLATELRLVNGTDKLNLDTDAKATGANGPCGVAPCFEPYDDTAPPTTPTASSTSATCRPSARTARSSASSSAPPTTTSATSRSVSTAAASPTSASSAATTRAVAAPDCPSPRATSSPSTTSPTSSVTSSPATTPSTVPSAPAVATSPPPRSSPARAPR